VSASASIDAEGRLNVTLCNADPARSAYVDAEVEGFRGKRISGTVLASSAMNSHNTFEAPDRVKPRAFGGAKLKDGGFEAELPPMSVVTLTVE